MNMLTTVAAMGAIFGMAACRQNAPTERKLRVAAAADLQFALDEIIANFQTAPTATVEATYGSSGKLFEQIENGAPFDLFLSADVKFPQRLLAANKAEPGSAFSYGVGRIVVWTPKTSLINVQLLGMKALLDPSVRKVSIANPAHAPYGVAAVAAMKHFGIYEQVAPSLVLGENVAQAAQFVQTGAADVGIIAASLAASPKMKESGSVWEIPPDTYPPLEQGGVTLSSSKQKDLARSFREAITGPKGRETLRRFGFTVPEP